MMTTLILKIAGAFLVASVLGMLSLATGISEISFCNSTGYLPNSQTIFCFAAAGSIGVVLGLVVHDWLVAADFYEFVSTDMVEGGLALAYLGVALVGIPLGLRSAKKRTAGYISQHAEAVENSEVSAAE